MPVMCWGFITAFRLILLFQPPLCSVLLISVDFSGPEAVVSVTVSHYGILEGDFLKHYLVAQSLVLFNIMVMLLDVFLTVFHLIKDARIKGETLDVSKLLEPAVDFVCAAMVVVYVCLMFQQKPMSAQSTALILNSLEGIPWSSPNVLLQVFLCMSFKHDSIHASTLPLLGQSTQCEDELWGTMKSRK